MRMSPPRGMFTLPDVDPTADPSATAEQPSPRAEVVIPTEAPAVDLVVPERTGSVVVLGKVTRGDGGISVAAAYPEAPGLYRLVPTLHTPSGEAYDEATQAAAHPGLRPRRRLGRRGVRRPGEPLAARPHDGRPPGPRRQQRLRGLGHVRHDAARRATRARSCRTVA